jgi:hypothetical protein
VGEVGLNNVVRLTVLGRFSASAREGDKAVLTKGASERLGLKSPCVLVGSSNRL